MANYDLKTIAPETTFSPATGLLFGADNQNSANPVPYTGTAVLTARNISGLAASATVDTTNATNITSGILPAAQLPSPSASALGGVKSGAAPANNFVTGIDTSGILQYSASGTPSRTSVTKNSNYTFAAADSTTLLRHTDTNNYTWKLNTYAASTFAAGQSIQGTNESIGTLTIGKQSGCILIGLNGVAGVSSFSVAPGSAFTITNLDGSNTWGITGTKLSNVYSLLDGITGYWKLDETSGSRTDIVNSTVLSDHNSTGYATGKINNAALFVAANSNFMTAAGNAYTQLGGGDFSISCWIKPTNATGTQRYIMKYTNSAYCEYDISIYGGNLTFTVYGQSTSHTVTGPAVSGSTWYFCVATYVQATGAMTFVVNGTTYTGTSGIVVSGTTNANFSFGALFNGAGSTQYADGALDEVGLWKRALSAAEIATLYATGSGLAYPFSLLLPALVACDGNSMTLGSGQTPYPTQLAALLGPAYTVDNFGIGGQTTPQMITGAPTEIDPLYSANNTDNIVVCWEGTNDIVVNSASAVTAYNNLVTYCQARRTAGFKVVILTILPRNSGGAQPTFDADRLAANASIVANWATFADALADVAADSRIGNAPPNGTYFTDGTHLNSAGYAIVASIVDTAITAAGL